MPPDVETIRDADLIGCSVTDRHAIEVRPEDDTVRAGTIVDVRRGPEGVRLVVLGSSWGQLRYRELGDDEITDPVFNVADLRNLIRRIAYEIGGGRNRKMPTGRISEFHRRLLASLQVLATTYQQRGD